MLLTDFLSMLNLQKVKDKSDFAQNVHKPFHAYMKYSSSFNPQNTSVVDVYTRLDDIVNIIKEHYAPMTVRNYLRYLEQALNLPEVKQAYPTNVVPTYNNILASLQRYVKQADKDANTKRTIPQTQVSQPTPVQEEDVEDTFSLQDSTSESPQDAPLDINEIAPCNSTIAIHQTTQNSIITDLTKQIEDLQKQVAQLKRDLEITNVHKLLYRKECDRLWTTLGLAVSGNKNTSPTH